MRKTIMAIMLLVSACAEYQSPYADAITQMQKYCAEGNKGGCDEVPILYQLDASYHEKWEAKQERDRNTAALILLGVSAGALAYSASVSHPTYTYQPIQSHVTQCHAMDLGGGMSTMQCY